MKHLFRLIRLFFLLVCAALMLACVAAWVFPGTTLLYPFRALPEPNHYEPPIMYVNGAAYRSDSRLLLHYFSEPRPLSVTEVGVMHLTNEKGRITTNFHGWGIGYQVVVYHAGTYRLLVIPLWMPWCAALLALLLQFALAFRRRRKQQPGLCPACSYDLRAHRPGQRCPECGAPIPQPASVPDGGVP